MPGTETPVFEPSTVASVTTADTSSPTSPTDPRHHQAALRALRELEATEARLQRAAERDAEQARGKLIQDLLPVLDNLDRTIAAHATDATDAADATRPAPAGGAYAHSLHGAYSQDGRGCGPRRGEAHPDQAMLEGVRMIRQQLEGVLRGYGAVRIDAVDQPFDPSLHEAIGVAPVEDPQRHGVVVSQAEAGYEFAGKLLRPAKVTVGKLVTPVVGSPRSWRFAREV